MDKKLNEMLDCYEVADADERLLDIISAAAQAHDVHIVNTRSITRKATHIQRQNPFPARHWLERAAAFAAVAVLGFWLGNASQGTGINAAAPATTTPAAQATTGKAGSTSSTPSTNSDYFENMLLGPRSINDILL